MRGYGSGCASTRKDHAPVPALGPRWTTARGFTRRRHVRAVCFSSFSLRKLNTARTDHNGRSPRLRIDRGRHVEVDDADHVRTRLARPVNHDCNGETATILPTWPGSAPEHRSDLSAEVIVPVVERAGRIATTVDATSARRAQVTRSDPLATRSSRPRFAESTVIGPTRRMNDRPVRSRLTQEEADERVLGEMKEHSQIEKRESYRHTVAICDRCKSRIEPRISLQGWCSMEDLRKPALEALRSGRVRYHPESQHRFAIQSLEDAPD